MLKIQAFIFLPVIFFFFLLKKDIKSPLYFSLSAVITITIIVLPFLLKSNLACFYNCCIDTVKAIILISGKATNIWVFDTALTHNIAFNTKILGITRYKWGIILTTAGSIIAFTVCYLRYGTSNLLLPALTGLIYTDIFLFFTKIQYRYIIYLLPFLIISACLEKKFLAPVAGFSVIALLNCTGHIWFKESMNLYDTGNIKIIFLIILSTAGISLFIWWILEILNLKKKEKGLTDK